MSENRIKKDMPVNLDAIFCQAEEAESSAIKNFSEVKRKTAEKLLSILGLANGDNIGVNGWSHKGKRMLITGAKVERHYGEGYLLKILGVVLKKDGSVGQHQGEHIVEFITKVSK